MFTGIVEALGRVVEVGELRGGRELGVEATGIAADLARGDSVAVNGVCQTVTAVKDGRFRFYAMGETLRASTLGELKRGDAVNLERALTPGSRLGGHFVSGHVDGVGRVAAVTEERGWRRIALALPAALTAQMIPKGSVAIDGISLTLGPELGEDRCEFFIIPHTLDNTTLGAAKAGDRVNIETDLLGKYVLHALQKGSGPEDERLMRLLREGGFLSGEEGKRDA